MSTPDPAFGLVLPLWFLWARERDRGETAGRKARPCVVVAVDRDTRPGETIVMVVPITTRRPGPAESGWIKLAGETARRLKLDAPECWIRTNDLNRFTWPSEDGDTTPDGRPVYGYLTPGVAKGLRQALIETVRAGGASVVDRDG